MVRACREDRSPARYEMETHSPSIIEAALNGGLDHAGSGGTGPDYLCSGPVMFCRKERLTGLRARSSVSTGDERGVGLIASATRFLVVPLVPLPGLGDFDAGIGSERYQDARERE
jgi:hypothetical protein